MSMSGPQIKGGEHPGRPVSSHNLFSSWLQLQYNRRDRHRRIAHIIVCSQVTSLVPVSMSQPGGIHEGQMALFFYRNLVEAP
jgi:hypothetical protein